MKHLRLIALLTAFTIAAPRVAEAKIFEVWGSGLIGAAFGNGRTSRDFFSWAGGGAAGFEVGAKVLFISAFVDYLRFFGGDAGANLVSFNLGGDGAIGFGGIELVLRGAGTFYVGTLDNDAETIFEESAAFISRVTAPASDVR